MNAEQSSTDLRLKRPEILQEFSTEAACVTGAIAIHYTSPLSQTVRSAMDPTYDNEARLQDGHRKTQDSLDAVAENALGLINKAAAQASKNIKTVYASAQTLSANLEAAKARIQELESVRHYLQERSERAEGWLAQISSEIEQRFLSQPGTDPQRRR